MGGKAMSEIIGHEFFELQQESPKPVISNLAPEYQLSEALDGMILFTVAMIRRNMQTLQQVIMIIISISSTHQRSIH